MSNQPFKALENFVDEGGFEYMPSEQSSLVSQHEPEVMKNEFVVIQEKQTPNKPSRTSHLTQGGTQQSLVYSASSYDTDVVQSMNSPQFGVQQHPQPPKPHILINDTQRINQMTHNLSNLQSNLQSSAKKPPNESHSDSQKRTNIKSIASNSPPIQTQSQWNISQNAESIIKQLEEQLTQERLNSEQLRVYNHIIKFELEKKLYNSGVFIVNDGRRPGRNTSPQATQPPGSKTTSSKPIDIYLEIQHNRIQVRALEGQFRQHETIIRGLEAQLHGGQEVHDLLRQRISELENQNQNLEDTARGAAEALLMAEHNAQQLEEEKDALCGCIDEQENVIKDLKSQYEQQRKQTDIHKDQVKQLNEQLDTYKRQAQTLEREIKNQRLSFNQQQEILDKQKNIEDNSKLLNQQISERQKEIMHYQLQLSDSQNRLMEYEQVNRDLSNQYFESNQEVEALRKQNDQNISQINMLSENIEQVTQEYDSYINKTDRIEYQLRESDKLAQESLVMVRTKDEQINTLVKRNRELEKIEQKNQRLREKFQKELNDLRRDKDREIQAIEDDRQNKANEIAEMYLTITDCLEYKEKYFHMNNERQQIIEEVDQVSRSYNNLQEENSKLLSELNDYKMILDERENASAKLNALQIKYQADIEYFESITKELQFRLEKNEPVGFSNGTDDPRLRDIQSLYDRIQNVLLTFGVDCPYQRPAFQFEAIIHSSHDLLDRLLHNSNINHHKAPQEDLFTELRVELQRKDKEVELYSRVVGSTEIQSLINEISVTEGQLANIHRQIRDIEKTIAVEQLELNNSDVRDITLKARSQALLKVSGFQDQIHNLKSKEKQLKQTLNKLEQDLDKMFVQKKKQNTLTERTDYQNLQDKIQWGKHQSLKTYTDLQGFDTFKADHLSSAKVQSQQDIYKGSIDLLNQSKTQQQNTIVKRKYFL